MRRRVIMFVSLTIMLLICKAMHGKAAEATDTLAADSSNFVNASLVVSAATNAIYSVFGHVTFRMECPTHGLDYVFTYESDTNVGNFMTFIAGKATAKYVAVEADTFLTDAQNLGRELKQYKLNLTHHEKQELWRLLDEDMMDGAHRHFNLLTSNCLSTTLDKIQACLVDDEFEWGPTHYPMTLCDGDLLRYHVRQSPWATFIYITFAGTRYDQYSSQEERLSPEVLIPLLREARLVDKKTGEKRPVISDEETTLVKEHQHLKATPFSPNVAFSLLLALTLLITLAEWKWGKRKWAMVFDGVMFTAIALVGLLLLFVTFYSELFGSKWNWYILLFNPLPLLVWIFLRKKKMATHWWLFYSVVLVLLLLATPLLGVLDLPHQLITCSVLTRSISLFTRGRAMCSRTNKVKKTRNKNNNT